MTKEQYYKAIMKKMNDEYSYLTARQVALDFTDAPTSSQVNTVGQILNVLALAGIVHKKTLPRGRRAYLVKYKLNSKYIAG